MRSVLVAASLLALSACAHRPSHSSQHHACLARCEGWNRRCVLDAMTSYAIDHCSSETSRCVRSCPY